MIERWQALKERIRNWMWGEEGWLNLDNDDPDYIDSLPQRRKNALPGCNCVWCTGEDEHPA